MKPNALQKTIAIAALLAVAAPWAAFARPPHEDRPQRRPSPRPERCEPRDFHRRPPRFHYVQPPPPPVYYYGCGYYPPPPPPPPPPRPYFYYPVQPGFSVVLSF